MEFLDPAPAANQGPRRRGRWAQSGVELSVRSMLDLRQLETLAPSPRGCSQDLLPTTPCGPGKHGQQAPETSRAVQVSRFLPVPSRPPDRLSQRVPTARSAPVARGYPELQSQGGTGPAVCMVMGVKKQRVALACSGFLGGLVILSGGWRLAARMLIESFQKLRNTSWSSAWLLGICPQS